ncbi:MAG: hypothetical protein GWN93_26605 [Deltaproteobacteria bacterium]|nr:hypothetical protein [Deltaproteobacteria bacterium]
MNQTDFPTLTVFIEAFGLQLSRVLSHLQDQVLSDVKAEITFGQVFPGRLEAIFSDGEIPKTVNPFVEKGVQEGIIFLGENSADMITSYGKTGTESRYIVSI